MRFESDILIRVTQLACLDWICLSPTTSLHAVGPTKLEATQAIRRKLDRYVNTQGAFYIGNIDREPDGASCPEGLPELSHDAWECKLDRQPCKLRAWIPITDDTRFRTCCHAPGQRKEDIYEIVMDGAHREVHYRSGCWLCPSCSGNANTRYRYPWELTSTGCLVGTDDDSFLALIESEASTAAATNSLCPNCLIKIISTVSPVLADELEIINLTIAKWHRLTRYDLSEVL